jgi:hypothetical protein
VKFAHACAWRIVIQASSAAPKPRFNTSLGRELSKNSRAKVRAPTCRCQPQSGKGPLFDHAKNGHLEVLMPKSCPQNPTIRARYDTYLPDFKKTTYPQIKDLVRSIEISKGILAENTNNRVALGGLARFFKVRSSRFEVQSSVLIIRISNTTRLPRPLGVVWGYPGTTLDPPYTHRTSPKPAF